MDASEGTISDKVERVEEIIEQIEDGDVSLERARDLHEEGHELLDELGSELELGDGTVEEH